ncbi:MAG: hypothetical protein HPY66_2678 [Firmicutes bacterium]|nr:hypothetical protein [Bacillota bacterium]
MGLISISFPKLSGILFAVFKLQNNIFTSLSKNFFLTYYHATDQIYH